ncbi:MAG: ATPase [Candidimonas sp.]|nr:MAG: ATPase [Candidimonas sp.]TAM25144.1 MAG: ATPase [Candidimonas sp.]
MSTSAATAYVEPIFKTIRVHAAPARAFEVFTAGMSRWWMPNHSINPTKAPIAEVVMEPQVGGRWFERGVDGSECDWGRVLIWEPPTRLVLAWKISAQWSFDPALHTEVEVRFAAQAAGMTQVTLEHRQLERYGDAAADLRKGLDGGWGGLLERYATVFAKDC